MSEISFVPLSARPDWLPVLVDWFESEWPDYFSTHDARAHFEGEMQRDALPLAIVAVASDTPIGTVAIREVGQREDVGPWLGGLYVHPELRGQGIGTALVRVAATLAWEFQKPELFVATDLTGFFERVGFEGAGQEGELSVLRLTKPENYYDRIGGEAGVQRLVDRFYDLMDEVAEARDVRAMHARSLKVSRDKLFKFLTGWMGGPNIYVAEYGHPRLRARHLPFSIGTAARDQWLLCMDRALVETVADEALRAEIAAAFAHMADHMRNRPGE